MSLQELFRQDVLRLGRRLGRSCAAPMGLAIAGLAIASLAIAGVALASTSSLADDAIAEEDMVRIATWNIANLHHEAGQSVPGRNVVRTEEDYAWLRHYANQLDADIVALQEINSRAAAHRLFSRSGWQVFISGRRLQDLDDYDLTGAWADGSIYTGFAVRRSLTVTSVKSIETLEVDHVDPRTGETRATRWAMEMTVQRGGQRLMLLSVHLKSGCTTGALKGDDATYGVFINKEDADCTTASRQVAPLRDWIKARLATGTPFVILGDYNRAFDVDGDNDHLWQGLTANLPGDAVMTRYPNGLEATCWKNAPPARYYRNPIDHMIFNAPAAEMVIPDSFGWLTFDPILAVRAGRISDHCPAYVSLNWPAEGPDQGEFKDQLPSEGDQLPEDEQQNDSDAVAVSTPANMIEIDVEDFLSSRLSPLTFGHQNVEPLERLDMQNVANDGDAHEDAPKND